MRSIKQLMEQFNRSNGKVKVITLLSPTCPECLQGFRMIKTLLDRFSSHDLNVFLLWVPMLAEDSLGVAVARSSESSDSRLMQTWDSSGQMSGLFAKTLNLQKIAWDVYLVYPRANVEWSEDGIQLPNLWMHQLTSDPGAPRALRLNNEVFFRRVSALLTKPYENDS